MCWHKWGEWRDVQKGSVTCKGIHSGYYVVQQKRCEKCGKVKMRTETTS
jgi:hypothetical protein